FTVARWAEWRGDRSRTDLRPPSGVFMAIGWHTSLQPHVQPLMDEHPLSDSGCATLARALFPLARQHDAQAAGLVVRANTPQGRYPVMRPRGVRRFWFHHVTVGVEAHCVDALTGTWGTPRAQYLSTH